MAGKIFEIAFNIMGRVQSTFNQSFTNASDKMTALNTRVSGLKAQIKDLDREFKQGKVGVLEYTASYEKLTAQMHNAQRAQQKFQKAVATQQRLKGYRDNSRAAMVGTIETAAVLAGPVYPAIQFETAMMGVAKQVEGARDESGELSDVFFNAQDNVMKASRDMMVAPEAIAKAYTMAAKSGVQGIENIDKFARMGIMMGYAFETPAEEITESFAKLGSALKIDISTREGILELEALGDTINYLDDKSNASGKDIIDVVRRISGTATNLLPTISRNALAGLSTGLLQMGERSETAGTALNSLFTKLASPQTQAKSFQEALAQIGMSADELQSGALSDAETTIQDLFTRIGNLNEGKRNNVLAELFGQEHIDTLSLLSGNYGKFLEIIKMGNSEAAKGSMLREFQIQSESTARKLEGMKAAAERASIIFTAKLLPTIQTVAGWVSTAANWMGDFSKENAALSSVIVNTGAVVLGGAVALSALAWAGWALIYPFVQLTMIAKELELAQKAVTAATWLTTNAKAGLAMVTGGAARAQMLLNAAWAASPVGLVIGAVAVLAGTVYLLYQNFEFVRNAIDSAWAMFQATFPNAAAILQSIGDKVAWVADKVRGIFAGKQEVTVGASVPNLPGHATGGIFDRPHLAWFAEAGPEAAIPLDGSPHALSLWAQAGEMLGVKPSGGGISIGNITFAPVLQGGDVRENEGLLKRAQRDFMEELEAVLHQQRRTSYA